MTSDLSQDPSQLPVEPVSEMYAARESSTKSIQLLEGMVYQTLGPHASDPVVAEVLAEGLKPLRGNCPFPHIVSQVGRTKSVLFTHEDKAFLYALGSASLANSNEGENQFVQTLCEALEVLNPQRLYIHEFQRMVRSADWAGKLMRTLRRTGTIVHTPGFDINLRTAEGRLQFQMWTMIADQERTTLVSRLFAGLVNKHRRGEWLFGPLSVPPGYLLANNRIVLDEAQIEPVKSLIALLADPSLGARSVLDLAGAVGCTSLTTKRFHGEDATFADLRRADSKVRSLLDQIPVWEHGCYVLRLPNPYPGVDRFGEYEVLEPNPPDHFGYIEFRYELDVPSGGWASPEAFEAARHRGLSRKERLALGPVAPTGGAAHRKRRPLSGWPTWCDDTHEYRISGNSFFYTLYRRPQQEGLSWTDDRGRNADRLASIDTLEIHGAIVESTVAALRNGAGVELIDALRFWQLSELRSNIVNDSDRKARRVAADVEHLSKSYEQARRNANSVSDPELCKDFLADANSLHAKLQSLRAESAQLASQTRLVDPDSFTSDAGFIAHGMAALANCGERAPAELSEQLAQILRIDAAEIDHLDRTVTFTFHLLLPADGKVALFGPVRATVANRAYRATLKGLPGLEQARTVLCDRFDQPSPHFATRELAAALVKSGWSPLSSGTLARSGVEPLYRIAFHHLGIGPKPAELDPRYVERVLATYSDPEFRWNARYHHLDCTTRQTIVDALVDAGGELGHQELIDKLQGTSVDHLDINLVSRDQSFGKAPSWCASVLRIGDWDNRAPRSTRSLRLVGCVHCDGWASYVVRAPEISAALLCRNCLRMPLPDSPVFPIGYLAL